MRTNQKSILLKAMGNMEKSNNKHLQVIKEILEVLEWTYQELMIIKLKFQATIKKWHLEDVIPSYEFGIIKNNIIMEYSKLIQVDSESKYMFSRQQMKTEKLLICRINWFEKQNKNRFLQYLNKLNKKDHHFYE